MSKAPEPESAPAARPNVNGVVGLIFSAIGALGMTATLVTIFSSQYGETTGDGQRDLIIHMENGLTYLFRVITGFIGLFLFGGSSAIGTVVSSIGLSYERPQLARVGLALGLMGLLICAGLIVWRMAFWSAQISGG